MSIDRNNIEKLAPRNASQVFTKKAVGALFSRELIEFVDVEFDTYSISEEGIIYIENQLDNEESFINSYVEEKPTNYNIIELPADIDDEWEPLPIDRTTPEYEKAVEALDDAVEKIEADNGYAANQPEERNSVVWSLKQGVAAIREMAPSLAQVRALVMDPLNSAIKTLKESGPGLAAMFAREALKEWIKSLFR
ncbi:MAG: hypothetical protein IID48_06960 [Proteobacteria bacterium]|nr:hypothetical protein [Pseudomonadota bacterium]